MIKKKNMNTFEKLFSLNNLLNTEMELFFIFIMEVEEAIITITADHLLDRGRRVRE